MNYLFMIQLHRNNTFGILIIWPLASQREISLRENDRALNYSLAPIQAKATTIRL